MFRTKVNISSNLRIAHADSVLFLGSCFAKNISDKAVYYGFNAYHPFGAIYNPASVLKCLNILKHKKLVDANQLFEEGGMFCNYNFHSSYSRESADEALQIMNEEVERGFKFFNQATHVVLTFGTAHTYTLNSTGEVVANCHHTKASEFTRSRLTVEDIASSYGDFVKQHADKQFIFTVSPIRYVKDGFNGSRLSKAVLLLAIERISAENKNCSYFPSYEIVEDELRDYRFYADDMIHPSQVAVNYIWERFSQTYFNEKTLQVCTQYEKLRQLENHRPKNPGSKEDLERLQKIEALRDQLKFYL